MHSPLTICLIGKSGCGKGTQAKLLEEYLRTQGATSDILYLYVGDHLRQLARGASFAAQKAEKIIANGDRIPDFLALGVLTRVLVERLGPATHLMIDGFPRSVEEAKLLVNEVFIFFERKDPKVILLEVSDEWATDRMQGRQRADDTSEAIQHRLSFYERDVAPTLRYYEEHAPGYLIRVNGEQPIAKVHQDIIVALGL